MKNANPFYLLGKIIKFELPGKKNIGTGNIFS
jgi:hypothetical protein